ncbi:MAG: hypothetical protein L0L63_11750 [Staphylococcus equorum]|nr:hypothetical protein [Staphylococcus equorum]
MAYEYEGYVKNTIRTEAVFSHEIEQKYDRILELEEVYRKARAFDEIKKFTTERLKEQELTDEYDYGERFMCEEIERLLEDKQND